MARVSTGSNSKQDYATPLDFLDNVVKRFGQITFDLAAEPHNKKHERYFGPLEFVTKGSAEDLGIADVGDLLSNMNIKFLKHTKEGNVYERCVSNLDKEAVALDGLVQDWVSLTKRYGGFLWLNPPFNDIDPWAEKWRLQATMGANGLFLVPAAVGANWYREHIWGRGDSYFLNGRLAFMGKGQPLYNKDCMLIHFHPAMSGECFVWDWKRDVLLDARGERVESRLAS